MKQFLVFVKKEWLHIWRDKRTLFILFGMPVMQILIFGFALSNEVKNSKVAVLDYSKDGTTQRIIQKLDESKYFDVEKILTGPKEIEKTFQNSTVKLVVVFPANFEQTMSHGNNAQIQLITDSSDPNTGTTVQNYANAIIGGFQEELNKNQKLPMQISTQIKMLYNPQLKSAFNFVPGVMAMVLMLVCTMMTSLAIVKEKEMGTMEIILVSPLKPIMVILAKAVPYLFLSIVNIISILLLSVYVLDLPIAGSLFLLMSESILFIITSLSLGLLISANSNSQQSAMFVSLIGLFMPTLVFSGFMFPIDNMPLPMQVISNFIPAKWFYIIVKSVMIKGLGFGAVLKETAILGAMTIFLIVLSVKKFKIRLA
ncbi:MAG: ABC transporter permease [Saprospiraceae bacterium]|jgi:ABC-2 type transport system permease protein|nr:ABC transporter permease [Saprospiraceae bacterium]